MLVSEEDRDKIRTYMNERWEAEDYDPMTICAGILGQSEKWDWKYHPLADQVPIFNHLGIEIIDD